MVERWNDCLRGAARLSIEPWSNMHHCVFSFEGTESRRGGHDGHRPVTRHQYYSELNTRAV